MPGWYGRRYISSGLVLAAVKPVTMSSTAGLDLTMTVYIICASPVGSSSGAASKAQGSHIVKEVQTKLCNTAKG